MQNEASITPREAALREKIERLEAQCNLYREIIESVSQGICVFDNDEKLVLCNRRYAEISRISPDKMAPGISLREIVDLRVAAGSGPAVAEDYLAYTRMLNASGKQSSWVHQLPDKRSIRINRRPIPEGGWIATLEDITDLANSRGFANAQISLQSLIDWVPDYVWVKDAQSRFVVVNRALAVDTNHAHTNDMIGLSDFDLHPPDLASRFQAQEQEVIRRGTPLIDEEHVVIDASGQQKWISSTKVPLRNDHNQVFGLICIARDISARKKAEDLYTGQSRIFEMIATNAPLEDVLHRLMLLVEKQLDGIIGSVLLLDPDDDCLRHGAAPSLPAEYVNAVDGVRIGPRAGSCGTAAYRREPVIVADIWSDPLWQDYVSYAQPHDLRSCWSTPILSHQGAVLGLFAMYSKTVREPQSEETQLIEFTTRIAGIAIERKLTQERIRFMANHDALTGLPNRTLLEERLTEEIVQTRRNGHHVTAMFIDLDNFKRINDTLGHSAGDELLKTTARRMQSCLRGRDIVVRLGGDEFVVVLSDHRDQPGLVDRTIKRLQASIAEPVEFDGYRLTVTASIGVATFPQDGSSVDALLANADTAMYRAKDLGRDNSQFYIPELGATNHEKFVMQEQLREAVARNEFHLLYQPQLDLRTGKIFAAEALIRWTHATEGPISPVTFIPIAEESGLIVPIGDWVLHETCRQNKAWQNAGLAPITVCVNVSARQFKERSLVDRTISALQQSGLDARYLELEVTESLIMADVDLAIETMKALQELGVQIAIDDFGTGYSSLSVLKTFPVARLKIDKSFIDDLAHDLNDQAVANAIISLGQKLNMRVVAEGVETEEQLAFLRAHNCDEMQGYQFSKPVAPHELPALFHSTTLAKQVQEKTLATNRWPQ